MSDPIDEAIAALRHGDQQTAFTLLRARLAQEPRDAAAWLWLSEATPDVRRKVEALTRFLALAPEHPHAPSVRRRLQNLQSQLNAAPPVESPTPESPAPLRLGAATAPLIRPPAIPSLIDRLSTSPQPVLPTPPAPTTVPPPPSTVTASPPPTTAPEVSETPAPKPVAVPPFTPQPAAPPPPNFSLSSEEEEDGMPTWVWVLMVIALVLVAVFIYIIINFDRLPPLFG